MHVRLPKEVVDAVRATAKAEDRKISVIVKRALEDYTQGDTNGR